MSPGEKRRPVIAERSSPSGGWPDAGGLGEWLGDRLGKPVEISLTRNRSTMLSWRERRGRLCVRMHRAFLAATEEAREALVRFLGDGDRRAGRVLDRFLAAQTQEVELDRPPVVSAGRFHDLGQIFDELNREFFHGACAARITWGHAGNQRYRRTIQLGCFVARDGLIRVHPSLDQAFVPRRYVAWVVFHEMLHEVLGVAKRGGRRSMHPPEFGALEETFPDFRECKAWERQHLHRLLCFRPERRRHG